MLYASAGLAWSQPGLLLQADIRIGPHTVQVEIANTSVTRQRGLMGRTHLPDGHGMLFVFDVTDSHCFWMKDTPLPLSIAFITDQGRIATIADMQPYTEAAHCPSEAVRYALEVPQGWFSRMEINPGDLVAPLPPS